MTYIIMIKNEIYTYKTKHEFAMKCLRHNLPFLLNNIPTIVKEKLNTHSLQGFAQYAKLYFLQIIKVHAQGKIAIYVCNIKKIQPPVTLILKGA